MEKVRVNENEITLNNNKILQQVKNRIQTRNEKIFTQHKTQEFNIGDKVRVSTSSLYSKLRQIIKQDNKKIIVVKYSPEIYIIDKVMKSKKEFQKTRYTLKDENGNVLLVELKLNNPNRVRGKQIFYSNELQKVDDDNESIISKSIGEKLNRI